VVRAREDGDRPVVDRDQRVVGRGWGEPTARTADAAGRAVGKEVDRVRAGEATDRGEPFEMVVTAHERNGEVIEEEKGEGVAVGRAKHGPARVTLDGRGVTELVRLPPGYWGHRAV